MLRKGRLWRPFAVDARRLGDGDDGFGLGDHLIVGRAELLGEDGPDGEEEAGDDRSDHEARDAEGSEAREGREQDHVVRHPGVTADEDGADRVVDGADHAEPDPDQDERLHPRSGSHEVDRRWRPHEGCPDGRNQRAYGHDRAPEDRRLQTDDEEPDPPDRPLNGRDDERPFDGRPRDGCKSREQAPFTRIAQREGLHECLDDLPPVAQEEEQEVERDRQEQDEAGRLLPQVDDAAGDGLTRGERRGGDPLSDVVEVHAPVLREPRRAGQQLFGPRDRLGQVDGAAGDRAVQRHRFPRHGADEPRQRRDHQHEDEKQRQQRRWRPSPAQPPLDPLERGGEEDRQNGRPEHGLKKPAEQPRECHRDEHDEHQEGPGF